MSAEAIPLSTVEKNQRSRNGTSTPMLRVRPEARLEAEADTTYPRLLAASSTFAFAPAETCPRPLSARETVAVETPAARATSSMLTTSSPYLLVDQRGCQAVSIQTVVSPGSSPSATGPLDAIT